MIVTSQQAVQRWGEIFGDDMAATAMIDRLIHHSEILSLKGRGVPPGAGFLSSDIPSVSSPGSAVGGPSRQA